jgi:hypothetical protein
MFLRFIWRELGKGMMKYSELKGSTRVLPNTLVNVVNLVIIITL